MRIKTTILSSGDIYGTDTLIDPNSINLKNYMFNPLVFFGYDYTKPIGKARKVWVENGELKAEIEFTEFFEFGICGKADPKDAGIVDDIRTVKNLDLMGISLIHKAYKDKTTI